MRELKNVLQRATLLAAGVELTAADLALPAPTPLRTLSPGDDELDRKTIEAALARTGGVIAQAAAQLGLSRQPLYRKMEKLSLPRE